MKNNLYFIIFFLIIGCTSKIDIDLDTSQIKSQGKTILSSDKNLNISSEELFEIKKLPNILKFKDLNNWYFPFYNSYNLLPHTNLNLKYISNKTKKNSKFNSKNLNIKNILYENNKIFYVDDYSNLLIYDSNLNLLNKLQLNKKNNSDYPIKFSLALNNKLLIVADNLGSIYAIDTINVEIVWQNNFDVPFLSNLTIHNNSIFVINANGKLFSFDSSSGKVIWSYETGTDLIISDDSLKIAIFQNKLIFTNNLAYVYCIDLDRKEIIWSLKIPFTNSSEGKGFLKFANLVIENDFLYLNSSLGNLQKINVNNGTVIWSKISNLSSAGIIFENFLINIDDKGFICIFDKNNGKTLYKKNILNFLKEKEVNINNLDLNTIFLTPNFIYLTTTNGYLISINVKDFTNINFKKIADNIRSNIIVVDNSVYFIGEKNFLYKFQ